MKKIAYIFLFTIFSIYSVFLIFQLFKNIELKGTLLAEQISILNTPRLFVVFIQMCILSLILFILYISIFWLYKEIANKEVTDKNIVFMGILIKTFFIFSVVITLLICLNETQFSVATTLISFFAIFSFVFSDNQKKSIEKFVKSVKKKINGED
ncbi:hypothetical protein [Enterococcus mundtii]|uniref:hypothetical protein n=1 Tax=Enterococcus mundtii TaxID=53346 RepID=UPI002542A95E|nr:hypothetical protein [Enterococcus mundtii]MDK4210184.1 hypothetical protein [Enterococcus mundtii]